MQAKARELFGWHIRPDVAGLCSLGEQILQELVELVLRSSDMLAPMHERRQFGAVMLTSCVVG